MGGLFISACSSTDTAVKEEKVDASATEKKSAGKETKGMLIGAQAPAFELVETSGVKFSSESIEGKPSVLVFWSVYCGKCKKETPQINQLVKEFSPKGVEVVGVNIGESQEEIDKGMKEFGIEYAVAADPGKTVMGKFGAIGTPTIVFLDKEGKVQFYGNKLPEDYKDRLNSMV